MRWFVLVVEVLWLGACAPRPTSNPFTNSAIAMGGNPDAGAACRAMGGWCLVGPGTEACTAQNGQPGANDCNPDALPSGNYCCLPCPADGGDCG